MKLDNDGYPKTCHACGEPVKLTGGNTHHHFDHATGERRTWHHGCDPARGARPPLPAAA